MSSKKARSEGARVAALIRSSKSPYFVADVELEDCEADVFAAAEATRKTLGKVEASFMLISAGVTQLIAVASLHESKSGEFSAKDWLLASVENSVLEDDSTDTLAKVVLKADTPFKLKDIVRAQAFAKLRACGQIEEQEEEDDEIYGFDEF